IVFNALARRIGVVTQAGADARQFVGGYRGADAAAADNDAALGPPFQNGQPNRLSVVRVINGFGIVGADIHYFQTISFEQTAYDLILQFKARMIGTDNNSHKISPQRSG